LEADRLVAAEDARPRLSDHSLVIEPAAATSSALNEKG
jgi:hypothetical protein